MNIMYRFNIYSQWIGISILFLSCIFNSNAQLIISEIAPNASIEALEQYGGGEWFEICNIGQTDMDISGYTIGHYEDASFGQSDFYLGNENDNCDCGGSYGVIKFIGNGGEGQVILPAMECIVISGMDIDCSDAYFCLNARDLMLNGESGIVQKYNSSRSDYPGTGNGNGRGALEGHYWRQKNYECNAYYIWNANDEIIDAVNFNCLPQTGPDSAADPMSGGFHYPDGNGGYYEYPPAFPTPPAQGPFPVGIEITNSDYTWIGASIEEGFTFQRCSNDPNFVFPPMKYDENGNAINNYYQPSCGEPNGNCCTSCDNNNFFNGIQLPGCTNGSAVGLSIEENEDIAEQEVLSSVAPSCNNNESRLRSNYDNNTISFCTVILTPNEINKPYVGFVNSLDEIISADDCSVFTSADLYLTNDCNVAETNSYVSSKGRPVFEMEPDTEYTLCFNYDISNCDFKNRVYWDNPCFSPFYCNLEVTCPETIQDTVNCLADIPEGILDTMLFRTELGGIITSSCDDVSITFQDSLGSVSGPKNQKIYYRTYTLTDGLSTIDCEVEYYIINRENPFLEVLQDSLCLDDEGMLQITSELLEITSSDYCGDPVEFTIIDPETISGNDLGEIDITITVIDTAENETSVIVPIEVLDKIGPTIDCPDDVILDIPACECEVEFFFEDPLVFDENEGPVTIIRTDTTGLEDGDLFPEGTTTISYEATDESGNITSCSYDVTINSGDPGSILVRDLLHFSLSEICDGYPTASMFLLGNPPCDDEYFEVIIFNEEGNPIHPDSLRYYRNLILDVEINYGCFDNSSESQILIEDKFAPQIACNSDTIDCNEIPEFGIPTALDNCDQNPTIIMLNETLENVSCTDPNLSRIITRTYTAIDDDGIRADTCYQVLSIRKFDLNTVTFNGIDTLIYCGNNTILDDNGNPSPLVTGSPMAGELSLWPDQNSMCGVSSTYEDVLDIGNSCGTTIYREWTVFYWDCFQDGMRQFFQEINIVDSVGPAFTCIEDITLDTEAFSCEGLLELALPIASDQCNNGVYFDITYPDGFESNITSISRTLPLGEHNIVLLARDDCGKTSICEFTVTVEDNEDPIAIVINGYDFDLETDGQELQASTINNGSLDLCGEVTIEIARMDESCGTLANEFDSSINICCEDVNSTVMVQFLVTDQSGNTSIAMVAVDVLDNISPILIEPLSDISISCDYNYFTGDTAPFGTFTTFDSRDTLLQDINDVIFSGSDLDGVIEDQCNDFVIEESIVEDYSSTCGTGSVIRTFIISDAAGNSTTSQQIITFYDPNPLTKGNINWPDDLISINESCDPADFQMNLLDPQFSIPTIDIEGCYDVAFENLDDIDYGPFEEDTLFVINRQWTGADWCQNDGGSFITFDSTQLIIVIDTREPTIIGGCNEINECNFSPTCEDLEITTSISGMDICTPAEDLAFSYSIDLNSDGSTDLEGNTNSATIEYPIGTHLITWTLNDAQNNTDQCFQTITVESCQYPTPICLQNLDFELFAIDTNDDDILDDEQVTIVPEDIDGGSFVPCDIPITLSFSEDINDNELTFNCDDIGEQVVQLYVTDENNNQDFCEVIVNIIDENDDNICIPDTPTPLMIQGNITNELGTSLDDVTLKLQGTNMATTSFDGYYAFPEMIADQYYTLLPEYDTYALDGITTLDIIKIRKHILGLDPLNSPYQILAADVDNSGSINGLDIIALRKLILGKTLAFENKENWEFYPADFEFIDPMNPWLNNQESVTLDQMEGDQNVDYFAVKTGDLNFSSSPFTSNEIMTRNTNSLTYSIIEDRNELIVGVKMKEEEIIQGFQFSFHYNPGLFTFKEIVDENLKIENSHTNDQFASLGVIDVSWDKFDITETDGNYSFYLIFDIHTDQASDYFEIETFSEGLKPEVYYRNGDISSLRFEKLEEKRQSIDLYQNEPNPWDNQTKISFFLPSDQAVSLKIYDVTGKTYFIKEGVFRQGINELIIDKSTFGAAGIYYYSLHSGSSHLTKKMILLD